MSRPRALVLAVFVLLVAWAGTAAASPITCPPSPLVGDRTFTLTTTPGLDASCLAFGAGNDKNAWYPTSGWTMLDASDDTAGLHDGWLTLTPPTSGLSGSFSIDPAAWTDYGRLALALKSGEGLADPDYAIFELFYDTTAGEWTIGGTYVDSRSRERSLNQALSHGTLYGMPGDDVGGQPLANPEPASMILLGSGLLGAAAAARRRRPRK